jgi:hypothetical protein
MSKAREIYSKSAVIEALLFSGLITIVGFVAYIKP